MIRSDRAMPKEIKAGPTLVSAPEFLAGLERSRILTDAKWREVRDRFKERRDNDLGDSRALARQLVADGTLTEFQARRLLKGKKGLSFGRYALVDQIGQGSRGRVFKARHRLMDRVVALKIFVPATSLSKTSMKRFFREMKIVALLDHSHVVRAIDADVHDGCPYIVMEYLDGDDLERVLARRGPLPQDEVIPLMAQAARGLAHAHEKGVIHRDIKPTNLFLAKSGIVKVLDLGFGELVGMEGKAGNVFDTDEGIVVGTTDFMSPEQVRNKPIDPRTDLFSLGCTMYRLLTAAYAFPGLTREARLARRIRDSHIPITEVRADISYRLAAIVDRLLALRPDDRFGSAAEVADALEALIPPAGGSVRDTSLKPVTKRPDSDAPIRRTEPEVTDWSMIESALRPTKHGARGSDSLVDRHLPKPPSSRRISSHRKALEGDGVESGREVHDKYRKEVIQMKRAMAELRATETKEKEQPEGETWLERIGEKLGDALAEPSALHILLAILAVLLIMLMALGIALE
jgi:eukaryotic-like serine/threonine-protein kinase